MVFIPRAEHLLDSYSEKRPIPGIMLLNKNEWTNFITKYLITLFTLFCFCFRKLTSKFLIFQDILHPKEFLLTTLTETHALISRK